MRIFIIVVILTIFSIIPSTFASSSDELYVLQSPQLAPATTFDGGMLGFSNPALNRFFRGFEGRAFFSTSSEEPSTLSSWGTFLAMQNLGFGFLQQKINSERFRYYHLSFSGGTDAFAFGLGYLWTNQNLTNFPAGRVVTAGAILRPNRFLSLGEVGRLATRSSYRSSSFELGIRPFGTPRFTLFGEGNIQRGQKLNDAPWSAGAVFELVQGINLVGRYFYDQSFTIGLKFSLGHAGLGAKTHLDKNNNQLSNSYRIRLGGASPNLLFPVLLKNKFYTKLELKGRVDYKKYMLFDTGTQRFLEILQSIQKATEDPRIEVIAINLSGMRALPEHVWEIRQELQNAQQAGKKIIAFIDNAGMTEYHLASVADVIMMDPEGTLMLPGYRMGLTYLKGTLEKLGLGFEEWRYFKYKSAMEALSREEMSEADREQRQAYIDDQYELVRREICQSRSMDEKTFDHLIDDVVLFLPDDALQYGLVDTLCRWRNVKDVIKSLTGKNKGYLPVKMLQANVEIKQDWGERPTIAVVYALDVCAMDEGIKARQLEKTFSRLKKDKNVKAVVFRVDSPGGDGMASDVVAEALRDCAKEKPVIVSQGQVAGSGGYWISMYGDTIVAGANTVTGSIGVIGGWLYDNGFSAKLGMTSDLVQRGKHADIGFGIQLPIFGIQLPRRNLTAEEMRKVEDFIKRFYNIFVEKVADGREMPVEEVKKIAEGHFYSGIDGKEIGLVDEIGTLNTAIAIARTAAKIPTDQKIKIREIPKYRGLFSFPLSPVSSLNNSRESFVNTYLKLISESQGRPLPLMVPGSFPELEQ